MAFSKSILYLPDEQKTAVYFKALNHPARLRIIIHLCLTGPNTVENLAHGHPLSEGSFSDHLKILRTAGLITCKEKYPYTIYYVQKGNLHIARKTIAVFFENLKI